MNRSGVYNYASAEKWLQGSKDKSKRTRSLYSYGLTLERTSPTSISVVYRGWSTAGPIVTYYPDGSCVIHGIGRREFWQSMRRMYSEYVEGLSVCIRKGQLIISMPVDGKTPSKVTKCRSCKGQGTIPRLCYGPTHNCWDEDCERFQAYKEVRDKYWSMQINSPEGREMYSIMTTLIHKHATCKHGYTGSHNTTETYDCHKCSATGQAEYGNKQKGRVWDGETSFGIDAEGNYIELKEE